MLIPSSIHEFICLPFDESTDIESLKEMITSVNNDVVNAVDQLLQVLGMLLRVQLHLYLMQLNLW